MTPASTLTDPQASQLRRLLEAGLPLEARPYSSLATQIGATEHAVLDQVRLWNDTGMFRRLGLVLHHRALGYRANAMLVLDVPDHLVDHAGLQLSKTKGINLCYQRPRRPPRWPYNLFCMIHGQQRDAVREHAYQILRDTGLHHLPHCLLFSTQAFKQCGGRYTREPSHG